MDAWVRFVYVDIVCLKRSYAFEVFNVMLTILLTTSLVVDGN